MGKALSGRLSWGEVMGGTIIREGERVMSVVHRQSQTRGCEYE
jgi:hypothetical protein